MFSSGGSQLQQLSDTVDLQEIAVYGSDLGKYAAGQQVLTFDKKLIMGFSGRSLGDLLQQSSGLYLRQTGSSQLWSAFHGKAFAAPAAFPGLRRRWAAPRRQKTNRRPGGLPAFRRSLW